MKKIFLLLIAMLLSGCTVKYNLIIYDDLSVDEEIYGLEDNDFYDLYYRDTKKDVVNYLFNAKNDLLVKYQYEREYYHDNETNLAGAKLVRSYENLADYINSTISYKHYFEKLKFEENDNIVKIYSDSNFIPYYYDDPEYFAIDSSDINIRMPFKVVNSNADSCNIDSGLSVCKWHFNMDMSDKSIYIEFDKTVSSKNVSIKNYIIIGLIVLGIIIFIYFVFFLRIKTRNNL